MYKITVSRECESIDASEMRVGDFAKLKGDIILRTYCYWVNLSNPQVDWNTSPEGVCELLPDDTVLVMRRRSHGNRI